MNKTAILIKHPHRSENLDGDVLLVTPVSWQIFGFSIYVIVSVGAIFISIASYARIETVTGSIAPAAGVASVVPTRSGVIAALPVQEGQQVQAGAELATVRAEEDSASGMTAAERIQAAIAQQDASLVMQSGQVEAAAQAQLRQLAAQREAS
jgi:membrane fusion protein